MTNQHHKMFKQQAFAQWYDFIPWKQLTIVNSELQSQLHVSRQTIANYYKGHTEIPELAIPVINAVAGRDIFTKSEAYAV